MRKARLRVEAGVQTSDASAADRRTRSLYFDVTTT